MRVSVRPLLLAACLALVALALLAATPVDAAERDFYKVRQSHHANAACVGLRPVDVVAIALPQSLSQRLCHCSDPRCNQCGKSNGRCLSPHRHVCLTVTAACCALSDQRQILGISNDASELQIKKSVRNCGDRECSAQCGTLSASWPAGSHSATAHHSPFVSFLSLCCDSARSTEPSVDCRSSTTLTRTRTTRLQRRCSWTSTTPMRCCPIRTSERSEPEQLAHTGTAGQWGARHDRPSAVLTRVSFVLCSVETIPRRPTIFTARRV